MTELSPAKTYWFKVVARNLVGLGQISDSISRIAATVPSPPINLEMVYHGTAKISFTWEVNENTGGSPVADYAIYWN